MKERYNRFVVFDTETPNWRNDRICSIGMCIVEDGQIKDEFYQLVNPECKFSMFNVGIHGITPDMVKNKPSFPELWRSIEHIFDSGVIVAHNAQFDMAVLSKCLRYYGINWRRYKKYACTCQMGRACMKDVPNHELDTLCRSLNIGLDHHNAGSDSIACAKLLIHYFEQGLDITGYLRTYDLWNGLTLKRAH